MCSWILLSALTVVINIFPGVKHVSDLSSLKTVNIVLSILKYSMIRSNLDTGVGSETLAYTTTGSINQYNFFERALYYYNFNVLKLYLTA